MRVDPSVSDLADIAASLTSSSDADFDAVLVSHLGDLRRSTGAVTASLSLDPVHGVGGDDVWHAVDGDLDGPHVWAVFSAGGYPVRVAPGQVARRRLTTTDPRLGELRRRHGLEELWLLRAAGSIPGMNVVLLGFDEAPPVPSERDVDAWSIWMTLLVSRIVWRRSGRGGVPAAGRVGGVVFEIDGSGRLVRWADGFDPSLDRLEDQVTEPTQEAVRFAVQRLLDGDHAVLEQIVQLRSDSSSVRLVFRRTHQATISGIVTHEGPRVLVLPTELGARLSPREREVAGLIAGGTRVRDVAAWLFVSESTVRNHLKSIFVKLGVGTQRELASAIEANARGATAN